MEEKRGSDSPHLLPSTMPCQGLRRGATGIYEPAREGSHSSPQWGAARAKPQLLSSPGFTGTHCEVDIDECNPDPCHYGTCRDGIAAFTCLCQPGYTGHRCDVNINECLSQPCKNGGTCQDRNNAYNCLCLKGTTGEGITHGRLCIGGEQGLAGP